MLHFLPTLLKQGLNNGEIIDEMIKVSANEPRTSGPFTQSVDHERQEVIVMVASVGTSTLKGVAVKGPSLYPVVPHLYSRYMTTLLLRDMVRPIMHEASTGSGGKETYSPLLSPDCKLGLLTVFRRYVISMN